MITCLDCKHCTKTHDGYMNDGMFYILCEQGKNWITPNAASYCNEYLSKKYTDFMAEVIKSTDGNGDG